MTTPISDAERAARSFDFVAARAELLDWFAANGRVFPWRSEPTPYRVLVSETMLQQTTTQTVLGYFSRFLERFPNVASLAAASETEVLKYWEGLGYYRRAKALRSAAVEIVERFGGAFPERFDDVLALPGVGRYTAGAVLSFGFNRRAPILEANTTRLNARLLGLRLETSTAAAQKILWAFAENWLPEEASVPKKRKSSVYRDLNGALTDLGRLVCAPSSPNCDACPLAEFCESRRLRLQNVVPTPKKKPEIVERTDVAFWVSRGDLFNVSDASATDVLLIRRPENALWAGLWDFPRFETTTDADATLDERLQLFLETEIGAAPFDYRPGALLTTVRHSVTRFRISLELRRLASGDPAFVALKSKAKKRPPTLFDALETDASSPKFDATQPVFNERLARNVVPNSPPRRAAETARIAAEFRWVPLDELGAYPLSSPGRKLAKFVAENAALPSDAK